MPSAVLQFWPQPPNAIILALTPLINTIAACLLIKLAPRARLLSLALARESATSVGTNGLLDALWPSNREG